MKTSSSKQDIIYYHKDGSLWAKGKKSNGKCDGYWEWFRKPAGPEDKKGTIMRSGHFKKGVQVGEWITYNKAGKVYKITNFS